MKCKYYYQKNEKICGPGGCIINKISKCELVSLGKDHEANLVKKCVALAKAFPHKTILPNEDCTLTEEERQYCPFYEEKAWKVR